MGTSDKTDSTSSLRQKAEILLKQKLAKTSSNLAEEDILKLIHELEVHQIELEMINEELEAAKLQAINNADKYTNLYDFAPNGYFTLTKKGKICELNLTGAKMLEKERSLLINHPFDLFVAHESKSVYQIFLNKLFKSNTKQTCELLVTTALNSNSHLLLTGIAIENNKRCYITTVDVNEQKQAERELAISEKRFKNIFNNSVVGKSITKIDGKITVNKAFSQIVGYTEDELNQLKWKDITHPEDIEHNTKMVDSLLSGTIDSSRWEKRYIHKKGHIVWVDINTALQRDEKENPQFFITSITDITERKKADKDLKFEQNRLRTLIDHLPDAIYVKDEFARKVIANQTDVENIGAASESEVLGKTDLELFPGEIGLNFYKQDLHLLQTGNPVINNEEYFLKNGVKNWLLTSKIPLFDEHKKIIGMVGIGHNITDRKESEKELIQAKEKAEESDRLKTAFLANMSHEIRTPMNGILGFSELLKEPQLTGEEQQKYIRVIEESGARMLNTINNIIDISKIEASQVQLSISKVDIREQVEKIVSFFKPEADKQNIKIIIENKLDEKDFFFYSDRDKIYGILTNLVKNALKYCDNGFIKIGINKEGNEYKFCVKDTGKGIPEERLQAIFERFIQADIKDREALQGSGLGLAISKSYIEMLGGKIGVTSKEGHGSTFYFTIPDNQSNNKEKLKDWETIKTPQNQVKKLNILIAEDDQVSILLLKLFLKTFSFNILTAQNGEEAIHLCKSHSDINLILMDIKMPLIDGYEATKKIREFNSDVIIIALTAFALSGDREIAISSGCNDYISKPINKTKLTEVFEKYFH